MILPTFHRVQHSSTLIRVQDTPANRKLREDCATDFGKFIKEFFYSDKPKGNHFWGEYSQMHQDFIKSERDPSRRGVKEAIAAPRGNAKTTFKMLIKAVHAICYKYHPFIIVVGYSDKEATDKTRDIRDELALNERLIEVFGPLVSPTAAMSDFITKNGVRVVARSRGGQIRGLKYRKDRPSLIILDDVESQESVNTPEQRAKTETWLKKDVIGAGSADGATCVIIVGTILHQESMLAGLLKTPGWRRSKYKALHQPAERQDLWDQWKEIYSDLEKGEQAQEDAKAFYQAHETEMLKGVEVLWPGGESYYQIQEFIIQNGIAAFNSEKQNDPFDPDKQILDPDGCLKFTVSWPGDDDWPTELDHGYCVMLPSGSFRHSNDLKVIAFHDPALAETKKSDYAAICVCAQDVAGYVYVLECYLKRETPDKQITAAFDLGAKWGVSTLYLEAVGFQRLLKPLYKLEAERREALGLEFSLRVIGVQQHQNKIHRIGTMQPYFSNRWIRFNKFIDLVFLDQLRLFPTDHDDGPDALHGCVSRLKKPLSKVEQEKSSVVPS